MTSTDFREWLGAMKQARLATTDRAASRLLGVHWATVADWKRNGTDDRTALACAALLRRLKPWPQETKE